jgi:hypothetical protein
MMETFVFFFWKEKDDLQSAFSLMLLTQFIIVKLILPNIFF